ncbi:MAG: histidine kinase [Candidatus Synoicihabitans palmerolidicus]|nr:histidine kinase [Candidatus Synoicihabitans palmerolidicus]
MLYDLTTTSGKLLDTYHGRHSEPVSRVMVHSGDNSVHFHFGTPGLAGEPDAYHTSRLIGFIDGGEEPTSSGERTFTNLPPGRYTFEASGRTSDHRWSEPIHFEFEVLAPWWLTSTAKTGYILAALISVYAIVRWRTRLLERQRHQLEQIVTARTSELANKAKALERLHQLEHDETLVARLSAETARLELLRYQLNPHFLFNSLNSIRALVYSSPATAGDMVTKLAEFCRRTLNRSNDEIVSVADEVQMARN